VRVAGTLHVPGDKSISHRALLVAALARGESELHGLLTGADVKSTARILRQLGADISPVRERATVHVRGQPFRAPTGTLDCGNSGTTARLILGILAGHPFRARLTGDASLRRRPMRRVTEPLRSMGARIEEERADTLPLTIHGGKLRGLEYRSPVASAQVKSALLLAGVAGGVRVAISEPYRSRDHTERLLRYLGLDVREEDGKIVYEPTVRLSDCPTVRLSVPGDISSAAFMIGAAVLAEAGELTLEGVGVNPTRIGSLTVLERMGARVERVNERSVGGEPVADLIVRPPPADRLVSTEVLAPEIPTLVDEIPILAVIASRARGTTVFRDVGELRVKESNRLELLAQNLRAVGTTAEARGNDLHVSGARRAPRGMVDTASDHRLAMAFAVLGTLPGASIRLSERESVSISYPSFFDDLRRVGASRGRR
jgi:3-phosphoshikimate 1-carboxyvinyltransferase